MKKIKVLGPGCPKCVTFYNNVQQAVAESGQACEVEKVTDMLDMSRYGIMTTPALVVDGEVKSVGKVLSPEAIGALL